MERKTSLYRLGHSRLRFALDALCWVHSNKWPEHSIVHRQHFREWPSHRLCSGCALGNACFLDLVLFRFERKRPAKLVGVACPRRLCRSIRGPAGFIF